MNANNWNWVLYDPRNAPRRSVDCQHPLDSRAQKLYRYIPTVRPDEVWQLGFICFDSYVLVATRKMGKRGWGSWRSRFDRIYNPFQPLNYCEACGRPGSRLTVRVRRTPLGIDPRKPKLRGYWNSRSGKDCDLKRTLCKDCHANAKADLKQIECLQLLDESMKALNREIYRVKKDRNNRAVA